MKNRIWKGTRDGNPGASAQALFPFFRRKGNRAEGFHGKRHGRRWRRLFEACAGTRASRPALFEDWSAFLDPNLIWMLFDGED